MFVMVSDKFLYLLFESIDFAVQSINQLKNIESLSLLLRVAWSVTNLSFQILSNFATIQWCVHFSPQNVMP
ncbi:hypothetical protein LCGC14_3074620 [marine sediment metagenome]|uniref:Uncharacterized protein n=1 Tax=marine sediment metagenome TaxID=412755 RepID=A0A0F8YMQ9_9ZZZZ